MKSISVFSDPAEAQRSKGGLISEGILILVPLSNKSLVDFHPFSLTKQLPITPSAILPI